ncbi:GAF and ANTAR domain-containing protein [Leifsonia sp. PS1209]|uniref:GAF and ANTAR domain-containing protein n=1 Tax=Leifsonia sp. PS1209 TaxID=2724914 RepID=UPI001442C8C2|nr:GAF and ANTAR domain-containing protein [Leifsonia sp. PS1209]QIZ97804.1 GAF and ANTAR domain-containing protein [Leifsonia sp. PS1209]
MSDDAYTDAALALTVAAENGSSLCLSFLNALPVTHAAISTLGAPFGSETICASDSQAARLDELQIDFGAGPCWVALQTRTPVVDADLNAPKESGWPVLRDAIRDTGIRSLYAFPLVIGELNVGAVDLYATTPAALNPTLIARASALADLAATHVARQVIRRLPPVDRDDTDPAAYSRREIHQATGMIIAQMRVNAADAQALLHAHAFTLGRPVREVAADVVARRIKFTRDDTADRD